MIYEQDQEKRNFTAPSPELLSYGEVNKKRKRPNFGDDVLLHYRPEDMSAASLGYNMFDGLFGFDEFVLPPIYAPQTPLDDFQQVSQESPLDVPFADTLSVSDEGSSSSQSLFVTAQDSSSASSNRSSGSDTRKNPQEHLLATKREKNRLAAEKCRLKKAMLIETLQQECDQLRLEKERLLEENARLLRALGLSL